MPNFLVQQAIKSAVTEVEKTFPHIQEVPAELKKLEPVLKSIAAHIDWQKVASFLASNFAKDIPAAETDLKLLGTVIAEIEALLPVA